MRRSGLLFVPVAFCIATFPCHAEGLVEPVFQTPAFAGADVDSVAVWVAPDPADSLMFVTEKALDRVEVWHATTGAPYEPMPFLGGELDSSTPGQFNRPNAVWVIYHVPFQEEFVDVLLVTEQLNSRVQIFRLPDLTLFGEFASGDLSTSRFYGRGICHYHDGENHYVYVTDRTESDKVKKYVLIEEGDALGAQLVTAFGDETGPGALDLVESVLADPVHDRLHICGDEGGDFIRVYDLEGQYAGITYGEPQFEFDQEGIVLYDTGGGQGYIIISDQYTNGEPNQYEVYDRITLEHLGHFESPDTGSLVTTNTDGTYLCQRPLPGFPNGVFLAIHDDANLHVYDWTSIAEAMGLEIVALDRPFALAGARPTPCAQRSLWHHDRSWWGLFAAEDGAEIRRLEDGTFAPLRRLGSARPSLVAVDASSDDLLVLATGESASVYALDYQFSRRRYVLTEQSIPVAVGSSERATLCRDSEGRAWIAWADDGRLRITWTPPGNRTQWDESGLELGSSGDVCPEMVRLDGATLVLHATGDGATARVHLDGASPEEWSVQESVGMGAAEALSATVTGERIVAALSGPEETTLWTRDSDGNWTLTESLGSEVSTPALSAEDGTGALHFYYTVQHGVARRLVRRRADGPEEPLRSPEVLLAVPGVAMGPPLTPKEIPANARSVVVASTPQDGFGYFARIPLPAEVDSTPPITLQHDPAPNASVTSEVTMLSARITDDLSGVDPTTLRVLVNDQPVPHRTRGVSLDLLVEADLPEEVGPMVTVRLEATDTADPPNIMVPFVYRFRLGEPMPPLTRGDVNTDSAVDISDAVFLLWHLFFEGTAPICSEVADADDNDAVEFLDVLRILNFLFLLGPAPVALTTEEVEACGAPEAFVMTTSAFEEGALIPSQYTCEGADISPPLEWTGAPAGTRSFALTCLDPDSRFDTWIHWIAWDIPAGETALAEDASPPVDGTNDWSRTGYGGPCPGRGSGFHRYVFTLYALDVETLAIPSSTRLPGLEAAMEGHVLGTATLMGRYRRD